MKNLIKVLVLSSLLILCSCIKDGGKASGSVVTNDVTNVSKDSFTFSTTVTYKGNSASVATYAVFLGTKPGVTDKNYAISTNTIDTQASGKYQYNNVFSNNILGMLTFFKPGETVYYRGYLRIFSPDSDHYILGNEKSFVVPSK